MAVIVQKYGGTSVGSLSRIEAIAENIIATRRQGHQVVVVLSAMAGETNRLLSLATALDPQPATRELDMLLSSGEQVSISLLAIALIQRGFSAISLLAHQVGIKTDNHFGRARIRSVDNKRLLEALEQEQVVVIAGFQGMDNEQNITTLGRGGSDTSAVAIAVALEASECQIYTDVDGIYSADPRIESEATRLEAVAFDEMLVMASLGAKVLQNRAVEYAMAHDMPIRVLSSFEIGDGTRVINEALMAGESKISQPVSNIAHHQQEALLTISDVEDDNAVADIFVLLGEAGIELDMISVERQKNCKNKVKFSLHRNDCARASEKLQEMAQKNIIGAIHCNQKIVKISAIGIGLKSHAGVAGKLFAALAKENINVLMISTSEITISVIVDELNLVKGVRLLHQTFGLNSPK
ncbi:aspartate kinase [Thalassomonas viridans]|uniref:Aspartokinase n=1 Tax=Thalassomonas viridans TaxID=137584 RepID=A0AAE9Z0Q7_9GAMM|nr:aspartate kinase [Thalassomonas viridans]WDE04428.1 aspartate kinase [Thalassomonas viridans]